MSDARDVPDDRLAVEVLLDEPTGNVLPALARLLLALAGAETKTPQQDTEP
jgi:hypothetical protein